MYLYIKNLLLIPTTRKVDRLSSGMFESPPSASLFSAVFESHLKISISFEDYMSLWWRPRFPVVPRSTLKLLAMAASITFEKDKNLLKQELAPVNAKLSYFH